jgi:hypothetical protein
MLYFESESPFAPVHQQPQLPLPSRDAYNRLDIHNSGTEGMQQVSVPSTD